MPFIDKDWVHIILYDEIFKMENRNQRYNKGVGQWWKATEWHMCSHEIVKNSDEHQMSKAFESYNSCSQGILASLEFLVKIKLKDRWFILNLHLTLSPRVPNSWTWCPSLLFVLHTFLYLQSNTATWGLEGRAVEYRPLISLSIKCCVERGMCCLFVHMCMGTQRHAQIPFHSSLILL